MVELTGRHILFIFSKDNREKRTMRASTICRPPEDEEVLKETKLALKALKTLRKYGRRAENFWHLFLRVRAAVDAGRIRLVKGETREWGKKKSVNRAHQST
jgi:hypothetical protein